MGGSGLHGDTRIFPLLAGGKQEEAVIGQENRESARNGGRDLQPKRRKQSINERSERLEIDTR